MHKSAASRHRALFSSHDTIQSNSHSTSPPYTFYIKIHQLNRPTIAFFVQHIYIHYASEFDFLELQSTVYIEYSYSAVGSMLILIPPPVEFFILLPVPAVSRL